MADFKVVIPARYASSRFPGKALADLAGKPLVVDADGLNLLAGRFAGLTRDDWILTPHPGEMARLMGIEVPQVQADRLQVAQVCAQRSN